MHVSFFRGAVCNLDVEILRLIVASTGLLPRRGLSGERVSTECPRDNSPGGSKGGGGRLRWPGSSIGAVGCAESYLCMATESPS